MSIIDIVAGLSRRLPRVRGAGVVANACRELALSLGDLEARRTLEWKGTVWDLELHEVTEAAIFFFPQLYNRRELSFLRAVTPISGCFVDVGANVGFFSMSMAWHVGSGGRCLAIEADPGTAAKLRRTVERNQLHWVAVSENGVSDRAGIASFEIRVDGNRGGSGLLVGGEPRFARSLVVEVQTLPLLSLLSNNGIARIDSMKVDLEGYEEPVFKAFFASAPRAMWPRHLVIEFLSQGGVERPLHAMLDEAGYVEKGRTSENLLLSLGRS